jgi:ribose/xylose/arabinose/galactoside ABC-type transport system permease subunit
MKRLLQSPNLPLAATLAVLAVLFTTASCLYDGFFSMRVVANLFGDNAFLGIAAVGMTLVILLGGIDLSVGSVLAFSTILVAKLIGAGWPPLAAMALAIAAGTALGLAMGWMIHRYGLPPFLVTLGGMFFMRGMSFVVSLESVGISHSFYDRALDLGIPIGGKGHLSLPAILFFAVFVLGVVLTHFTKFGRNVFAIGGSESSAKLMGLPVGFTKVAVYGLSGLCAALAGVVATFYMGSGNPAFGVGFELDVIAAVVIGGTLLTGGVGSQAGTLTGVLIFGTLQTALVFDGRLNSWWLRIAIGGLRLTFILLQKAISSRAATAQTTH